MGVRFLGFDRGRLEIVSSDIWEGAAPRAVGLALRDVGLTIGDEILRSGAPPPVDKLGGADTKDMSSSSETRTTSSFPPFIRNLSLGNLVILIIQKESKTAGMGSEYDVLRNSSIASNFCTYSMSWCSSAIGQINYFHWQYRYLTVS
jgi:hypothetical protein